MSTGQTASDQDTATPQDENLRAQGFVAGKSAAANRTLLFVMGAVSILAGVGLIAMPFIGSLTAALATGWILLVSGCLGMFSAFRRDDGWQVAAAFALAVLSVITGVLILLQPIAGILALTTLIIAYFAAGGILRIYYGIKSWGQGGGFVALMGAISLALAVLLWFGLPFTAVWVPGVLLGADLLIWGVILTALAIRVGRAPQQSSGA